MLKRLHNHIFASKLKQLFTESPIVVVSQTLGSIDQHAVKQGLREGVVKHLPKDNVQVQVCRINNAVAAGTRDQTLQTLFHTSNLLIGFSLPQQLQQPAQQQAQQQQQQQQQQSEEQPGLQQAQQQQRQRISKDTDLQQLVGGILQQKASAGLQVPHPVLKGVVEACLALPAEHPVVLLGAFYQRQHFSMSDLSEWVKLDDRKVYAELLAALESPAGGLLTLDSAMEEMLGTIDACRAEDVVQCLEFKAAAAPPPAAAEGGATAAAAAAGAAA